MAALDPLVWMKNVLLTGVSATTLDTLALLAPRPSPRLAVATAALGVPLLVIVASMYFTNTSFRRVGLGLSAIALVIIPHAAQGHVSELYAYPVVAVFAVLGASAYRTREYRGVAIAIVLFAAGSLATDVHKATAMVRTGSSATAVGYAVASAIPEAPAAVCLLLPPTVTPGYSVFVGEPGPASGWGRAAQPHWGWQHPVRFFPVRTAFECPAEADVAIAVEPNGAVTINPID